MDAVRRSSSLFALVPSLLALLFGVLPRVIWAGIGTPLPTIADQVLNGVQAGEAFGTGSATAGDVNGDGYSDLIVGMPDYDNGALTNAGRVMVFHGSPTGLSATPAWTMTGSTANARFGASVSTAGDVNGDGYSDIIIGAPGHLSQGGAFVYHGSATGLSATVSWSVLGGETGSNFGACVALAGDVNGDGVSEVLVGAPLMNASGTDRGQVRCYAGATGTGLSAVALWTSSGTQSYAYFGFSIAGAGDVNGDGRSDVVVGEPNYDASAVDRGRIHVFHSNGTTLVLNGTRDGSLSNILLGYAVSAAGDMNGDGYGDLLVGVPGYTSGRGRVMIFRGGPSGIEATSSAVAFTGPAGSDRLGTTVALAGDVNGDGYADVVCGEPLYDGVFTDGGRAYVFVGEAALASLSPYRTYTGTQANARLGGGVGTGGDVNGDGVSDVVVGSPGQDGWGQVSVYHGGPDAMTTTAAWDQQSNVVNAEMGYATAHAGDVNGDGFADVLVGFPGINEARLYLGSLTGLQATAVWTGTGSTVGERFGAVVCGAGDVNGDGYSDVLIGAPAYDSYRGRAYVFLGSASGLGPAYHWRVTGSATMVRYGEGLASAGDLNGDGYSDIVVSASMEAGDMGTVYAYHGGPAGLSTTASWTEVGWQINSWFGASLANAGDANGDGYDDLLVGAMRYDEAGRMECGAVFLYRGSAAGLEATPFWTKYGDQAGSEFGIGLAFAGDLNGDGYSDMTVAAYQYVDGPWSTGRVYVYHGSVNGYGATEDWMGSDPSGGQWGMSIASAGDVNGDGYGDLVIGSHMYSQGYSSEGRAVIHLGSASGVVPTPAWSVLGGGINRRLGYSVCGAGDVDGDGYGDVVVGAPEFVSGEAREGRTMLFMGAQDKARSARTRQYRTDLTTPVQTSNGTFEANCSWGIGQEAWSALGRAQVKLVWEHKGHGPPFQGAPFNGWTGLSGQDGGWVNTGLLGLELKRMLTISDGSTAHPAWRVRVRHHPATMLDGRVFGRWYYHGLHDHQVTSVKTQFGACGLLPVELISIRARCDAGEGRLEWVTATERNCATFIIERSVDGRVWQVLGAVDCKGNSQTRQNYVFDDSHPLDPLGYYRIRQVDASGEEHLLPVVTLAACGDDHGSIKAWPNPTTDLLNVDLGGTWPLADEAVRVDLLDATGRVVGSRLVQVDSGPIVVDVGPKAAGVYTLVARRSDGSLIGHVRVVRN